MKERLETDGMNAEEALIDSLKQLGAVIEEGMITGVIDNNTMFQR